MKDRSELIYKYLKRKPLIADEIVAGCVAIFRNAWDEPEETIDLLESKINKSFKQATEIDLGTMNQLPQNEFRRSNYDSSLGQAAQIYPEIKKIHSKYNNLIVSAGTWYKENFNIENLIYVKEDFLVLKYETGNEYKLHFDGTTLSKRSISPILYLNDNYEGGELEFPHHNVKIKPEAGMLILFPSNFAYAHIAHPVTSGTKYAIVTWLHDQP